MHMDSDISKVQRKLWVRLGSWRWGSEVYHVWKCLEGYVCTVHHME